ncbi:MAG: AgmX/PglI C-terminal domain-containing protein [Myxococcota bacterium]
MMMQSCAAKKTTALGEHRSILTAGLVALMLSAGCASMPHEKHPGTLPESLPQDEYVAFDDEGRPAYVCHPTDPKTLSCRAPENASPNATLEGPLQQDGIRVVSESLLAAESERAPPLEVVEDGSTYDIQIRIARDGIYVDDEKVADLIDGRVPAEQKIGGEPSLLIRPLREKLYELAPADRATPSYIVITDRTTEYRVTTEVAYTLGQAGMLGDTLPNAVITRRHDVPLYCEASEQANGVRVCHAVGPAGSSDKRVSSVEFITVGNAQNTVPRLTIKAGDLQPFCDKQHIGEVIANAGPKLRYCWEKQLVDHPELAGKIMTRFKIMPDGTVAEAGITESTMDSEEVEACLLGVLEDLEFQEPDGGICAINYPFVFGSD